MERRRWSWGVHRGGEHRSERAGENARQRERERAKEKENRRLMVPLTDISTGMCERIGDQEVTGSRGRGEVRRGEGCVGNNTDGCVHVGREHAPAIFARQKEVNADKRVSN